FDSGSLLTAATSEVEDFGSLFKPAPIARDVTMQNPRPIDPRWAWQRYEPSDASPWDVKKAGHVYRRAAFGATMTELEEALRAGPERTIDKLLAGAPDRDSVLDATAERLPSIRQANSGQSATAWWLYRVLYTTHPLR